MYTLNCKGRLLTLDKPSVMGIINVNTDSFYANSRQMNKDAIQQKAAQMLDEGARYIDIGGQSTHPQSPRVSPAEEISRVVPAIEVILAAFPDTIVSIDTYYSEVAAAAVQAGALIVNDISSGALDSNMLSTVADLEVPYIAMHMRGNPNTMAGLTDYEDVTQAVLDYFTEKIARFVSAGIKDLIIDPGFGFAKSLDQNYQLLSQLEYLHIFDRPVLVGLSRKSMIYKALNIRAEDALTGTTALNTYALQKGAHILRVHDVKAAVEVTALMGKLGTATAQPGL